MKFPDEYFPVEDSIKEDFLLKVNEGKNNCKNLKILFCATCKDVVNSIEKSISFCHEAGKYFKDYDIFLYENNSLDGTAEKIKALKDKKITLKSEFVIGASYERSSTTLFRRCNLISNARNKYVEFINSHQDYDYIFVFDTDISGGWSLDGIFNSIYYLENNSTYGCMTSYCVLASPTVDDLEEIDPQNWMMFDSFAFRYKTEDWSFPNQIHLHNYIKVKRGTEPVEVNSNFNGLAIYKPECFSSNKYYVKNHGSEMSIDSEHVGFHKNIWDKGLKVLLNPSMITSISKHKYCKEHQ